MRRQAPNVWVDESSLRHSRWQAREGRRRHGRRRESRRRWAAIGEKPLKRTKFATEIAFFAENLFAPRLKCGPGPLPGKLRSDVQFPEWMVGNHWIRRICR